MLEITLTAAVLAIFLFSEEDSKILYCLKDRHPWNSWDRNVDRGWAGQGNLDPATVSAQRQGLYAICSIKSATYTYQRLAHLVHLNQVENSAGDHLYRVFCSSDFSSAVT